MHSYLFFCVVLSVVYHANGRPQDEPPNSPIPLDECIGLNCGESCGPPGAGVCDGDGVCVSPIENPCAIHGCQGLECGESCLSGDIVGVCNVAGECVADIRSVTVSGECGSKQCKRFGQTCGPGAYGDEGECCYENGLTCLGPFTLLPGAQSTCGVCEDHLNWIDDQYGDGKSRCIDLTLDYCNNHNEWGMKYIREARKNCPKSCGIC